MTLNFRHNEIYLKDLFEKVADRPVTLTLTDNATSMISVKARGDGVAVRLHRIFLEAGANVVGEIAGFIKKRRGKTPLISSFIREKRDSLRKKAPRRLNLCTLGKHHNLLTIYEAINRAYFNGSVSSIITWGAKNPRYAVRKRTLGSFSSHSNVIRINPLLDNKRVPLYFIEFIVYHEMLHAHVGVEKRNGRSYAHSKEFRKLEKLFRDYEKAVAWEKANRI